MKTALVLGAGGFIGSHLVNRLKSEGYWVRGVDLKYPEYSESQADEMLIYDLRNPQNVESVMAQWFSKPEDYNDYMGFHYLKPAYSFSKPFDEVYQLAADMGGAGFVFTGEHDADIMHNSALINLNVCHYVDKKSKVFYSSSACMYPQELQNEFDNKGLKESDAYPGNPDSEYGWEKLFSERLFLAYARNYGLDVRIARFHNIYGPEGTYKGGREKAPAAMCRKAIEAQMKRIQSDFIMGEKLPGEIILPPSNEIEVWGTGHQTRSFLYIDDCIDAVRLLMQSEFKEPINIGSEEIVTINQLAQMAIELSGKDIKIKNVHSNAVGVMGRNSNNELIEKELGWKPKYSLRLGMVKTFNWIKSQYDGNK
jgi:GDP-D-mannose 3',5'-epimerase